MEKHEQQRKQNIILGETRAKLDWDDELTFQPERARKMPDFERAQRHFQALLDKKRSHKKPTQPVPFNFEQNKKIPQIHYLETDNEKVKRERDVQAMRDGNERNLERMRATSGAYVPDATKAYIGQVELNKKERLKRAEAEEKKVKEEEAREKRRKEAAVKLRETLAAEEAGKKKDDGEKGPTKKEQFKETTKTYNEKLKKIKEDVDKRPPVFQTCILILFRQREFGEEGED